MIIFQNCLKRIFGKKINVVFMIVIPIVLNTLIISIVAQHAKYNVGIIDLDQSKYTDYLVEYLEQDCNVTMLGSDADVDSLVLNSKQDIIFTIPKDFAKNLVNQTLDKNIQSYYMDGSNISQPIELNVASFVTASKQMASICNGEDKSFYEGMDTYLASHYTIEYRNFSSSIDEEVGLAVQTLGYLAFSIAFLMAFATALVLEDKVLGVYRRIQSTPLHEVSYYAQHLLGYFLVALLQISVAVLLLPKVADVNYGKYPIGLIGIGACFAGVCIAIGLTISKFAKNNLVANAVVTIVELPMLMLSGCLWPYEIMPEFLKKVGNLMPSRWFLMASESYLYQEDITNYAPYIVYMLLLIAVLMVGTFYFAKRYHRE